MFAGIVVFGGTLASISVLGIPETAALYVIVMGVIILYQSISLR
jgi:hypothetical protein